MLPVSWVASGGLAQGGSLLARGWSLFFRPGGLVFPGALVTFGTLIRIYCQERLYSGVVWSVCINRGRGMFTFCYAVFRRRLSRMVLAPSLPYVSSPSFVVQPNGECISGVRTVCSEKCFRSLLQALCPSCSAVELTSSLQSFSEFPACLLSRRGGTVFGLGIYRVSRGH